MSIRAVPCVTYGCSAAFTSAAALAMSAQHSVKSSQSCCGPTRKCTEGSNSRSRYAFLSCFFIACRTGITSAGPLLGTPLSMACSTPFCLC